MEQSQIDAYIRDVYDNPDVYLKDVQIVTKPCELPEGYRLKQGIRLFFKTILLFTTLLSLLMLTEC